MPAPVLTIRRATAPHAELSSVDYGNVLKGAYSSVQTFRIYNNYSGSSSVSDAEDVVMTIRCADGNVGSGRAVGLGDQIQTGNWFEVKNLSASDVAGTPVTEVIDEVLGVGDGADATWAITYGSTSSSTQVPNNTDSEDATQAPAMVLRVATTNLGTAGFTKTAAAWEWSLSPSHVAYAPIVGLEQGAAALTGPSFTYSTVGAVMYDDTITLSSAAQTNPEPSAGTLATCKFYWNDTLTYTTDYTYANGLANGVVTFEVAAIPALGEEIEVDYLYYTPDSSYITIPDDDTTASTTEDGHEIGGRCWSGDITDNNQNLDATVGAATVGAENFKNTIKDAYSFKDGATSYGWAEVATRINVDSGGTAGSESFLVRVTYTYV